MATCAYFAVYITVLQTGVSMFVSELTISFEGISNKLLKGAIPAVDCTAIFGVSPLAPTYGFIFGFLGQLLAIFILVLLKSPILIIAGFICIYIDNGTLAIFANKFGGRRAAAIIPFFAGLIQVFGSALVLSFLIGPEQIIGWTGMFDWATLFMGIVISTKYLGIIVPIVVTLLLLIIPQIQYKRSDKEKYFDSMRY